MKAYHWRRLLEAQQAARTPQSTPAPPAKPAVASKSGKTPAPRRGPPICIECAMHAWSFDWITGKIRHRCHDPMTRDPVTGEPTDPYTNRRNALSCGPNGTYWVAKPAAPSAPAQPALPPPDTEPQEYVPPVPVRVMRPRPWVDAPDEIVVELWPR